MPKFSRRESPVAKYKVGDIVYLDKRYQADEIIAIEKGRYLVMDLDTKKKLQS